MKLVAFPTVAACVMLIAGCASTDTTTGQTSAATKEERCTVTGSNVPKRDCRGDVTVLPPSAVDSVMPVLPGPGNRP